MADEFQLGSGNWWESTRSSTTSTTTGGTSSSRFETSTGGSSPPSSTPMNSSTNNNYGWPTSEIVEPPRPTSNDSSSATAAATSLLFQTDHTHSKHLQQQQQQLPHHAAAAATSILLSDPNLHMMGLGLSSQHPMDHWNQPSLSFRSSEKGDESSFRTMLQEDNLSSNTTTSFQQAEQWPRSLSQNKMLMYSSGTNSQQDSSRGGGGGFSLDQSQLISQHQHHNLSQSTEDSTISFHQMDSSSSVHHYQNNPPSSNLLPGLLGYEMNQQQQITINSSSPSNYDSARPVSMHTTNYNSYPSSYGININSSSSSVDHQQQQQPAAVTFQQPNSNAWSSLSASKPQTQLHFSNNAPFWNASNTAAVLPSLQMQSPSSTIDQKPKKSSSSEASTKRPRNEPSSALPAFKVRKEKMGDRITALQQLVSPFGKTDTASVLSEAIEYIKFLHQQVSVLSDPYMKSGAPIQQKQQQGSDHKSKDQEGEKQDLRSRGLCLVPVSSTFPVTHETTVDFWNPTFGGTFR